MKEKIKFPVVPLICIILAFMPVSCKKDTDNPDVSSFTDARDGSTYNIVKLGNQTWMAGNLAYLPSVSPSSVGAVITNNYADPYYYVYDYEGTNIQQAMANDNYDTYGVLYNWKAALTACPTGWHLPTDDEWKELEIFLGMSQSDTDVRGDNRGTNEGSKIAGNSSLWDNGFLINNSGFNSSKFMALPAGFRSNLKYFTGIGGYTTWWCSSEEAVGIAWSRELDYDYTNLIRCYYIKDYGFSIRCVKD